MKPIFVSILASVLLLPAASAALGQVIYGPGAAGINAPLPPPPLPGQVRAPIFEFDGVMPPGDGRGVRRRSFGDRVTRCLEDGAGWGLNPSQRAAYSRACANGY